MLEQNKRLINDNLQQIGSILDQFKLNRVTFGFETVHIVLYCDLNKATARYKLRNDIIELIDSKGKYLNLTVLPYICVGSILDVIGDPKDYIEWKSATLAIANDESESLVNRKPKPMENWIDKVDNSGVDIGIEFKQASN